MASAICVVRRSCTWGRLAKPSTRQRQLREPGDAAVVTGYVHDVHTPVERGEVMLAERVQRDVPHQHHLVVVRLERDDQMLRRVFVQPTAHLGVHLGNTARSTQQAVAVGILADREQDLAYGLLQPVDVDTRVDVGHVYRCSIGPVYSAMNGRLR